MNVIKRNGTEVPFDPQKIAAAVRKASNAVEASERLSPDGIRGVQEIVTVHCVELGRPAHVEEIQDAVESALMKAGFHAVARAYITYRYSRMLARKGNSTDAELLALLDSAHAGVQDENSNKNPSVVSVQRDYMAGMVSKDLTWRLFLPADIAKAHDEGILHFHDADYFAQRMHNCSLVNLEDMLQNGTVISGTRIERPHSFSTACNIATQIIAQVASCQYGGQTVSLAHLAPFVDVSRRRIRERLEGTSLPEIEQERLTEALVSEEIRKGVQTLQYQVITLMTTNGQAPFISVFMNLNEARNDRERTDLSCIIGEMLRQRLEGVQNESGAAVTPAFPKLLYVLGEGNLNPGDPYFHLTELAARCAAVRMAPDFISEAVMKQNKVDARGNGHCYPCMGCRSFLTPYIDAEGKAKYYGRFNQGVVTVNLPDAALASMSSPKSFRTLLDERLDLCHRALKLRHERLEGTLSDAAPILWQHGALARLPKGAVIDPLLHDGYSTLSLGYAGLWECVFALTGKKLTEPEGREAGLAILKHLNEAVATWREAEHIDYSLYGTPIESTTYRFASCLRRKYGLVPGVTDKSYITNSYHIHVTEPVDAFTKLRHEAHFQLLSPGGAVSYVELPNMAHNPDAVLALVRFIADTILYAEINIKSDCCQQCGFDGEIRIVEQDGKLLWQCPQCGNTDRRTLSVARRTCGYIGTQFWNQGRTAEIRDRVMHL